MEEQMVGTLEKNDSALRHIGRKVGESGQSGSLGILPQIMREVTLYAWKSERRRN
jgi:hypothetical protein